MSTLDRDNDEDEEDTEDEEQLSESGSHQQKAVSPAHRKRRASSKPSAAEAAFPLADYIVPPTDPLGRSTTLKFSAAPDMSRMATIIVQRKCFPFETPADVVRWCVYHGLRELMSRMDDKEVTATLNTLEAWVLVAAREIEQGLYAEKLDSVFKGLEKIAAKGHVSRALMLAEMVWQQADKVEEPYWRRLSREWAKTKRDEFRLRWKEGG